MKTLTRPMFNMGGPIKQGIMHGIREPKKHGGTSGVGHGLVGDKRYPKTGGREHHWFFLPYLATAGMTALRAAPLAYRGFRAARTLAPGKLGAWGRIKSILGPSTRYRGLPTGKTIGPSNKGWFKSLADPTKFGAAVRQNPLTALTALTIPGQATDLVRKHGADVAKGAWGLTKRYADAVIPGDQSSWWKDKEPPTAVPLNPNLQATIKAAKELSTEKKKEFALQQREDRVQKYLKMMGYDRAKKTAIADALIDASKIVSDRGTLDLKNIGTDLINPIIQATSKRLDKPDQIREAVGLMATKAEIEKDLSKEKDALKTELTQLQIEGAKEDLKASRSFEGGLSKFISARKGTVDPITLERISRLLADEHGETFTKIEEGTVPSGDGIYMIDSGVYRVTDGNAKQIA